MKLTGKDLSNYVLNIIKTKSDIMQDKNYICYKKNQNSDDFTLVMCNKSGYYESLTNMQTVEDEDNAFQNQKILNFLRG